MYNTYTPQEKDQTCRHFPQGKFLLAIIDLMVIYSEQWEYSLFWCEWFCTFFQGDDSESGDEDDEPTTNILGRGQRKGAVLEARTRVSV